MVKRSSLKEQGVKGTAHELLQEKITNYSENFTMHGISRILSGHVIESCAWLLMVLTSCSIIVFFIYGLSTKYLRKDVYLEFKTVENDINYIPMLTLCFNRDLTREQFCDIRYNEEEYYMRAEQSFPCEVINKTFTKLPFSLGCISLCESIFDGGFSVETPSPVPSVRQVSQNCFLFNLTDTYIKNKNGIKLKFEMEKWRYSTADVIVHEESVFGAIEKEQVRLSTKQTVNEIRIEKADYKRLPNPFPSNCTPSDSRQNIFPGAYTMNACQLTTKCTESYKRCGSTFDFCRPFIPDEIKKKYSRSRNISQYLACFMNMPALDHNCQVPCDEEAFRVFVSKSSDEKLRANVFQLNIDYPALHFHHSYEEKELYSIDQLISECGGLIGLFLGGSIISFIEVLAIMLLLFVKRFVKSNSHDQEKEAEEMLSC